ncbi:peptidase [Nocardioides sp. HDW12B]|uniref:peptidase n=1 Tax=Nocardioides sp. HDW12B TaxID=2714939 RepID=UPI00140A7F2F|nr:peptidase [Nocardioides sp. HDW12B]QIK67075.1 peptidase [Nocardioides sp. HDW12B]
MEGHLRDRLTLGPYRRRRWMRRRLAQLDREYAAAAAGRAPRGRRPRKDRTLGPLAALALFAVIVGAGGMAMGVSDLVGRLPWAEDVRGTPPDAPDGPGAFAFSATQPGRSDEPVGYSPCEPLRVVLNDDQAPDGVEGLVEDALADVATLTGLRIELVGPSDELPTSDGSRALDAPALIAWTDPDQVPALEGRVAGLGGSTAVEEPLRSRVWLRTGQVALDSPDLAEILDRPGGREQVLAIVRHEIGHLVGLDHTPDSTQLMHSENVGVADFQNGDRRGLARLGEIRCR